MSLPKADHILAKPGGLAGGAVLEQERKLREEAEVAPFGDTFRNQLEAVAALYLISQHARDAGGLFASR